MTTTPYGKLGSQDILSAHINGLQFGINNLETALNLQTTTSTETLAPVIDMDDTTLRYRIYEATNRNWLNTPAPVIKRNGVTVSTSEYVIQPPYGVVVFNVQQQATDNITADVTYVTSTSTRLNTIETNVSTNATNVSNNTSNITNLQGRVTTLESTAGSTVVANSAYYPSSLTLLNADPQTTYLNTVVGGAGSTAGATASVNIGMVAGAIDAFPVFIDATMTFDRMRVMIGNTSGAGNIILGIYTNANMQPAQLVAQTASTAVTSTSGTQTLNLTTAVTLSEGLYWFVRYQTTAVKYDGFLYNTTNFLKIQCSTSGYLNTTGATTPTNLFGVRTGVIGTSLTTLPTTFPAVGSGTSDSKYIARDQMGVVYGIRK